MGEPPALHQESPHSPPLAHGAPDPACQLGDIGVHAGLVLLATADAPAHDARQVPLPAFIVLYDQGTITVSIMSH